MTESSKKQAVHVVNTLDEALEWCEDRLLEEVSLGRAKLTTGSMVPCDPCDEAKEVAQLLHLLCPVDDLELDERADATDTTSSSSSASSSSGHPARMLLTLEASTKLATFFTRRAVKDSEVVWHQGDSSSFMVFLYRGKLMSFLEHEAGTSEPVHPGNLVGEFGVINQVSRLSTLSAVEDSVVYVLDLTQWNYIKDHHSDLAYMMFQICIHYLGRRCNHVSNRVWESNCLPI